MFISPSTSWKNKLIFFYQYPFFAIFIFNQTCMGYVTQPHLQLNLIVSQEKNHSKFGTGLNNDLQQTKKQGKMLTRFQLMHTLTIEKLTQNEPQDFSKKNTPSSKHEISESHISRTKNRNYIFKTTWDQPHRVIFTIQQHQGHALLLATLPTFHQYFLIPLSNIKLE